MPASMLSSPAFCVKNRPVCGERHVVLLDWRMLGPAGQPDRLFEPVEEICSAEPFIACRR